VRSRYETGGICIPAIKTSPTSVALFLNYYESFSARYAVSVAADSRVIDDFVWMFKIITDPVPNLPVYYKAPYHLLKADKIILWKVVIS
jgi:hypothetical protein